jgi:hypothetical protein
VEPVAHNRPRREGSGASRQDEKDGLESVLGVANVTQHSPANAVDHRAVPTHQRGKRRLVPPGKEFAQELPVGLAPLLESVEGPQ